MSEHNSTEENAQSYLDQLLSSTDDGIVRDYDRDVIFAGEVDEISGTFDRLVKRTDTSTHPDGRVEVSEYLAVEYLRAQVGGGHYVRDFRSISIPASRAGRTELLIKLAASLGLDVRID